MKNLTYKQIDTHLRERGRVWWAVLYKKLVEYFENRNKKFNLLEYNSLTLRDVCEKVWYIWLKDIQKDNYILELDSTIAYFK